MKNIKHLFFAVFITLGSLSGARAVDDFGVAAQLLAAAKNADIAQVQALVNNGADINYVDATGLSIVCTALMNKDFRAAQILQMYGADASQCDQQIKRYNGRQPKTESGGLFSGLSTAQEIALSAAGAAVVIGGVLWLSGAFDSGGNNNDSGSAGGICRPGSGCVCSNGLGGTCNAAGQCTGCGGGGNGGGGTAGVMIPGGPAYFDANGRYSFTDAAFRENMSIYSDPANAAYWSNFNYFRPTTQPDNNFIVDKVGVPVQNYLLMMHGYAPLAHGYTGRRTFRLGAAEDYAPVRVMNAAGGGRPVLTALITKNGINPTGSAGRGDITYADSAGATANTFSVDKYLNYVSGGGAEQGGFDFSGTGTVFNPFATSYESALAKIVGGWEAGGELSQGDFYGFVPNGQLAIFRTGGGEKFVNVAAGSPIGTLNDTNTNGAWDTGETINVNGTDFTITLNSNGTFSAENSGLNYIINDTYVNGVWDAGETIDITGAGFTVMLNSNGTFSVETPGLDYTVDDTNSNGAWDAGETITINGTDYVITLNSGGSFSVKTPGMNYTINGYVSGDNYYVDGDSDGKIDSVYVTSGTDIVLSQTLESSDIKNFEAMFSAVSGQGVTGWSRPDVVANVAIPVQSKDASYLDTADLMSLLAASETPIATFVSYIDQYYGTNKDNSNLWTQGQFANSLFAGYNASMPMIVMPAGEYAFGVGSGKSIAALDPMFENYAPALYASGLNQRFMTIVAVNHATGTEAANNIAAYGDGSASSYGKLGLSAWTDANGDVFASRKCGVSGLGAGGADPWCFASAGATAEMATSAAAGAVAAVRGAFDYMTDAAQVFRLLALTSDGHALRYDDAGNAYTADSLMSHLKTKFVLPSEYNENALDATEYLRAFAEVYGYGLINLERATMPGHNVYFFDGNKIVSGDGNAYWRTSTLNKLGLSGAFGSRAGKIKAPFYDILESFDGTMKLPRVWENSVQLGGGTRRGMYVGDMLGEFKAESNGQKNKISENMSLELGLSESLRGGDNLGGLDKMSFEYTLDNWEFGVGFARNYTDRENLMARGDKSNAVLGLVSNSVETSAKYRFGNWSFGGKAISGIITQDGLLENDPTISGQYISASLGGVSGGELGLGYEQSGLGVTVNFGAMRENNTILGAQTGGFFDLGGGDTVYADSQIEYGVSDNLKLWGRATFARTVSDPTGEFVLGMTDIDSNSYSVGLDWKGLSFMVSRPLAVRNGSMSYAYADYAVIGDELEMQTGIEELNLAPETRETRFSLAYRSKLGERTSGAFGFMYRINPDHTKSYGNESIFMMKLRHAL